MPRLARTLRKEAPATVPSCARVRHDSSRSARTTRSAALSEVGNGPQAGSWQATDHLNGSCAIPDSVGWLTTFFIDSYKNPNVQE